MTTTAPPLPPLPPSLTVKLSQHNRWMIEDKSSRRAEVTVTVRQPCAAPPTRSFFSLFFLIPHARKLALKLPEVA